MERQKINYEFIEGAIPHIFIAKIISRHSINKAAGAYSIFLGQVRNDRIKDREVRSIEYSAYREMAEEKLQELCEETLKKYSLTCLHIYHSIGRVDTGQISLFVFVSAKHRKEAMKACEETVERIKKEVPVWGKEIFTDESYQWKINS